MKIIIAADGRFREMVEFADSQAKKFGYETLVYDLGGLGIGEEFSVAKEELTEENDEPHIVMAPFKPRLIRHALRAHDDFLVWIDADAFIIKPIDEAITNDYDIGVTMRRKEERGGSHFPDISGYLNSGVIFLNNTIATKRFVEEWNEITQRLDPQSDQYGINELVRQVTDLTEYNKVFVREDGLRIKVFECDEYNYYYLKENVSNKAKILHFKGQYRKRYDEFKDKFL